MTARRFKAQASATHHFSNVQLIRQGIPPFCFASVGMTARSSNAKPLGDFTEGFA